MEQGDNKVVQQTETNNAIITEENKAQLTPNQLKKLKQKLKKAQQKEELAKQTQENQTEEQQQSNDNKDDSEITFEDELQWCIKQLKLGQERNNLEKDQIEESNKVISKLESDKTTYVAKRHLMRVIFGDYRKLMKTMK